MRKPDLFAAYENAKICEVKEYKLHHPGRTVLYEKLPETQIDGVPVCLSRNADGKLEVTFTDNSHVLAIGSTRSGKTTGFVIPTLHVMMNRKNKPDLVVSDPKLELYTNTAAAFRENGYKVVLLDFTKYERSDCWNPLLPIYRKYQQYKVIKQECIDNPPQSLFFMDKSYKNHTEYRRAVLGYLDILLGEVDSMILSIAQMVVPYTEVKDPFWDDCSRDLLRAFLYGLLEYSDKGDVNADTFSFDSIIRIFDTFSDASRQYDKGFFTNLDIHESRAHQLAAKCIIEQASSTRRCIASAFATKISKFRDSCARKIMCADSFSFDEMDSERPVVIFLAFKDEEGLHYDLVSMFLSNLYTRLIDMARNRGGSLHRPCYFLLDEFGNLPKFNDFDKVISACGSRNLWFLLVLQSYAQLYRVYGKETAEIIKDNLNVHMFFGTNNAETKREFSNECGKRTVVSPVSALNGEGETIDHYQIDTVPLVPVSSLTVLPTCTCIVTQMRENVLQSHLERSYMCPEFNVETENPDARPPVVDFNDPKYIYKEFRK